VNLAVAAARRPALTHEPAPESATRFSLFHFQVPLFIPIRRMRGH
jgi:hypothetical protein